MDLVKFAFCCCSFNWLLLTSFYRTSLSRFKEGWSVTQFSAPCWPGTPRFCSLTLSPLQTLDQIMVLNWTFCLDSGLGPTMIKSAYAGRDWLRPQGLSGSRSSSVVSAGEVDSSSWLSGVTAPPDREHSVCSSCSNTMDTVSSCGS